MDYYSRPRKKAKQRKPVRWPPKLAIWMMALAIACVLFTVLVGVHFFRLVQEDAQSTSSVAGINLKPRSHLPIKYDLPLALFTGGLGIAAWVLAFRMINEAAPTKDVPSPDDWHKGPRARFAPGHESRGIFGVTRWLVWTVMFWRRP